MKKPAVIGHTGISPKKKVVKKKKLAEEFSL
jgi:hypothetical protein